MSWIQEEINKAKTIQNTLVYWALIAKKYNSKKEDQYWRDLYNIYNLRKSLEFHIIYNNLSNSQLSDTLKRLREYQENINIVEPTFVSKRGKDTQTCLEEQVTYPDRIDVVNGASFINHICKQVLQEETTTVSTTTTTTEPISIYAAFIKHICIEELVTTTA